MIVFDLDGTLRTDEMADKYIPEDKTKTWNWLKWQDCVLEYGQPIERTVKLFKSLAEFHGIIILTSSQYGTSEWLIENNISYYMNNIIIERSKWDHRPSFNYKKDFIDEHKNSITLWVDDNEEICDYVESLNIATVRVKR